MNFNLTIKRLIGIGLAVVFTGVATLITAFVVLGSNLPKLITVQDYDPLLVSHVYDRNNQKIGEFFKQKRELLDYDKIPDVVKHAFIASEDDSFFKHNGINYFAIFRAVLANIKAGKKVQGASTITQQVARTLLLSREKTYTRKIKEAILAHRMEANLSKEEILYLYLNQIYLGQGAYGVGMAAKIYFRKPLSEITLKEAAILAGLPKAPSAYSPINNPKRAKERQIYVLTRMAAENYITEEQSAIAKAEPLTVYTRINYREDAPFYLEILRQMLVKKLGEEEVLENGIKIYTGLDIDKQKDAQNQVKVGLRDLDKRQGFRGAEKNTEDAKEVAEILLEERNRLIGEQRDFKVIQADGSVEELEPLNLTGLYPESAGEDLAGKPMPPLPDYVPLDSIVKGVVTKVDDKWGITYVRFAESKGLIDLDTMKWARTPDPTVNARWAKEIEKPSEALKKGDVIYLRVSGRKFYSQRIAKELKELKEKARKAKPRVEYERPEDLPLFDEYAEVDLEQEPLAQGALVSIDQRSSDVLAMVGGYDFAQSQFNRALQATRQTGSSFKPIVYASGLDKGYNPSTAITDAPIVYEEEVEAQNNESAQTDEATDEKEVRRWKPTNHSKRFMGDILFRNALIRSLNVPTVKIIEKTGVNWVADYARRLGIFSPLNLDYTLALGSSGVTLFEITKVFSQFGRLGKRVRPLMIKKVEDQDGNVLLENISLDDFFEEKVAELDEIFEKRRELYLDALKNPEKYEKKDVASPEAEESHPAQTQEKTPEAQTSSLVAGEPETDTPDLVDPIVANFDPSKEPPIFFESKDQLIDPKTAFVTTNMLRGVVEDSHGTGQRAKALGRPVAGKTGSTSDYYDAWFVGYTPDISTGVWVGYDQEKTLGRGEVGGRAALPIWLEYMKTAHEHIPTSDFDIPEGVVFVNIDKETGLLASASSEQVVRQAFIEGSEPQDSDTNSTTSSEDDKNFFKDELAE